MSLRHLSSIAKNIPGMEDTASKPQTLSTKAQPGSRPMSALRKRTESDPSSQGSRPMSALQKRTETDPSSQGNGALMSTAVSPSSSHSPERALSQSLPHSHPATMLPKGASADQRPAAPTKTRPNTSRPSTGIARGPEGEPAGRSTPPPSADRRERPISRPSTALRAQSGRSTPSARRPTSAATDVPRERPHNLTPRVAARPSPRKAPALLPTMRPKSAKFTPTHAPAFSSSSARPASATLASPWQIHVQSRPDEGTEASSPGQRGRSGHRANRASPDEPTFGRT